MGCTIFLFAIVVVAILLQQPVAASSSATPKTTTSTTRYKELVIDVSSKTSDNDANADSCPHSTINATNDAKSNNPYYDTPTPTTTVTANSVCNVCPPCDISQVSDEFSSMIPQPDPDVVGYPVSRYIPIDRRSYDQVDTVRPEHTRTKNPLGVSDMEWKLRTELAAAYRALHLLGIETNSALGSDQAAQCLMLRVPPNDNDSGSANSTSGAEITFLMADWGIWFEEVTASNLLKFSVDGMLLHPPSENGKAAAREPIHPVTANIGCIPVAKAIFESRPDVHMIVHIHPLSVMAVSGTKVGLLPLSQASFFLWGQVSREEYDFTYENDFETTLVAGFRDGQRAMLLNHHGMYAVGRDVAEGTFVATHLTQACEVQVRTMSMAGGDLSKLLLPSGKQLSAQYKDMMDSTDYSYDGSREWPGIVRKVQRQAKDYNT